MFKQKNSLPNSAINIQPIRASNRIYGRRRYALFAELLTIIIVVAALVVQGNLLSQNPQKSNYDSTLPLALKYLVGEQMMWMTTNVFTDQGVNSSQILNLTKAIRVIGENSEEYNVEERVAINPNLIGNTPMITINIPKTSFYNNFIPMVPSILYNASANPTTSAYLTQKSVHVGDVWKIPVNTGNSSFGMTGEVTLNFTEIKDITVPAGTYRTMKISITSNTLNIHADSTSKIIVNNMTLQLNGTTYLEQGTCRLIKADLTQLTSSPTNSTSMQYSETTLVKHIHP